MTAAIGGRGGSGQGRGARDLKKRVRTAKGRTTSQQKWLERQLNDPYVAAAKREGYRSRAAFKLIEIADKYKLLRRGMVVIDLGAAPGGWSQIAAQRVGPTGKVVAIDILDMPPLPGVIFTVMDFMDDGAPARLKEMAGGLADLVMSDMAPNTTGHRETDHLRIVGMAEAALAFAVDVLKPGGAFICKVRQGGSEKSLLDVLKRHFAKVAHVKPPSSRADSTEMFVAGTGFRT